MKNFKRYTQYITEVRNCDVMNYKTDFASQDSVTIAYGELPTPQ